MKKFKERIIALGISVAMGFTQVFGVFSIQPALGVSISDTRINDAIKRELKVDEVTDANLDNLTSLNASWLVRASQPMALNLAGLQDADNLNTLFLGNNQIDNTNLNNISPILAQMTKLKNLYLNNNQIANINNSNLWLLFNRLEGLDLQGNNITDLTGLNAMTNIQKLWLEGNNFTQSSFPSLNSTTATNNLSMLQLGKNDLTNINFLEKLYHLTNSNNQYYQNSRLKTLYLGINKIGNISVLKNFTGLQSLDLGINPLGDPIENAADTPEQIIQTLEGRGVDVNAKLVVTSPYNNFQTNYNKVTITGRAEPGSVVYINNAYLYIGPTGKFTKEINLDIGNNAITVSLQGTAEKIIRNIVYDPQAPVLTMTAPVEGARSSGQVKVEGLTKIGTKVTIKVNGEFKGEAITNGNGKFNKLINLSTPNQNNLITLEAKIGEKFTTFSRYIYYDLTGPNLTVSTDRTATNEDHILVTGTTEPGSIVKINGSRISLAANSSFQQQVYLSKGSNLITVTSTDSVGNVTTKTLTITYDTEPPKISLSEPAGLYVQTNSMTVNFAGSTEESSILRINDNVITTNQGKFSKIYELTNGVNNFVITATDPAGNVTKYTIVVNSYAPSIDEPIDNYRTKNNTVTIRGKGTADTTIKINNVNYKVPKDGIISKTITLVPGTNNIIVEYLGSKISRRVIYDASVELSISNPQDNAAFNNNKIIVRGATEVDGTLRIKVNSDDLGTVSLDNFGNFTKEIDLKPGENVITFIATDYMGNTKTIERKVSFDNTPPTLSVLTPIEKTLTNTPYVIGIVEFGSSVKINNEIVTVDGNGNFKHPANLKYGDNIINIVATDKAGNTTTVSRQITFDNVVNVSINNIPEKYITKDFNVNFTGSADLDSTVKVNDQSVNLDASGSFQIQLSLKEGKNTFVFKATDPLGNVKEIKREVIVDNQPPAVQSILTDPYSSSYSNQGNFKLSFLAKVTENDSPIDTYELQWRTGNLMEWKDLGKYNKSTVSFKGTLGSTYFFRARAMDKAGNLGEWTSGVYKTIIPYDDNSQIISRKGFNHRYVNKKSSFYSGTLTYSLKANEEIVYRFTGNEVALIGYKAKDRSKAKVFIDGKYSGTIDAYSKTPQVRQTLFKTKFKTSGIHTVKVVNLATKGRVRFDLDGIAIGRG